MINYFGGEFQQDPNYIVNNNIINNFLPFEEKNWGHSGRYLFYEFLKYFKKKSIKKVFLPSYLCPELLDPVKKLDFEIEFYNVNFDKIIDINLKKNSVILMIHYFGKNLKNISQIEKNLKTNSYIIEDLSHVYLNNKFNKLSSAKNYFFTMRKHFGCMYGGFSSLNTKNKNKLNKNSIYDEVLKNAFLKFNYIKNYINKSKFIEDTYLDSFKKFESKITKKYAQIKIPHNIIKKIKSENYENAILRRQTNWKIVDQQLKNKFEKVFSNYSETEVPLGYVIMTNKRDKIRDKLISKSIFTHINWNLPNRISISNFPKSFKNSKRILTIPIDQRYSAEQVSLLANVVKRVI